MKKIYGEICTSEFLYREAHTIKTINNEIFVNLWNGEYISRANPLKRVTVFELYPITKNVEKDSAIVATRNSLKYPLRFLIKSKPINKK